MEKNYETVVFGENLNNKFDKYIFISELIKNKKQITSNFILFKDKEIVICSNREECIEPKTDYFYRFYFDNITNKPFAINYISEVEHPKGFIAAWESKYIWVFYKWILIEKHMTLIS